MAAFDTKQLRDRETPMTLDLSNLADRKQPTASFSPVFTPQRIRPYVAPVMLRKVDEPAVLRHASAQSAAKRLGSHGRVVKILIGEYPLYLCGEECLPAVRQDPRVSAPAAGAACPARPHDRCRSPSVVIQNCRVGWSPGFSRNCRLKTELQAQSKSGFA